MTSFPPIEPSDHLVYPALGVDPEPSEPTNPDLWAEDPFYDPDLEESHRKRLVAVASVALSVLVVAIVGAIGWMFGIGSASGSSPSTVYRTVDREVTTTVEVPKTRIKKEVVTRTARPAPQPVPTVTVIKTLPPRPAPTITTTVKATQRVTTTATVRATATVTEEVQVPVEVTVTETIFSEP